MIFKRILINNFGGLREKRHRTDLWSKCALWTKRNRNEHCVYLCEEHVLWSARGNAGKEWNL